MLHLFFHDSEDLRQIRGLELLLAVPTGSNLDVLNGLIVSVMNLGGKFGPGAGRSRGSLGVYCMLLLGFDCMGGSVGGLGGWVGLRVTDTNTVEHIGEIVFSVGDESLKDN